MTLIIYVLTGIQQCEQYLPWRSFYSDLAIKGESGGMVNKYISTGHTSQSGTDDAGWPCEEMRIVMGPTIRTHHAVVPLAMNTLCRLLQYRECVGNRNSSLP